MVFLWVWGLGKVRKKAKKCKIKGCATTFTVLCRLYGDCEEGVWLVWWGEIYNI